MQDKQTVSTNPGVNYSITNSNVETIPTNAGVKAVTINAVRQQVQVKK